VSVE
jgi:hypothetical protein